MNLRFLSLLLIAFPLCAQLELPDSLFLDEAADEESRRVAEGHKASEEKPKEDPKEAKEAEAQRAQVLQMINNPGPIVLRGAGQRGAPNASPENRRQIERLTGGVAELVANLTLVKGGLVNGRLANQVIRVEASFGSLPLRLGELQRIQRQEDGSFLFEMRDGDLLQGKPQHEHFTLNLPDGGKRVVPLLDLSSLDLSPVADEPVAP